MSGIPATGAPLAAAVASIGIEAPHWLDVFLNNFNTSPYFIGSRMLMMNLGGRFLSMEMSKGQEAFFSHPWIRRFLIFVVFFIGTRSIWVAFWMAFIVILLLGYLFNENSSLCLFHGGLPGSACAAPAPAPAPAATIPLTAEEQNIYRTLHEKVTKAQAPVAEAPVAETPDIYEVYKSNLEKVKHLFE
jgi:hypothetical protein